MDITTLGTSQDEAKKPADGLFYEYSKAANPIRPGLTPRIPYHFFSPDLCNRPGSFVLPLDMSADLKCPAPATGPGLCANFVRVQQGNSLTLQPNATSIVLYIHKGAGMAKAGDTTFSWKEGDFLAAPAMAGITIEAESDATLYAVHDAPLMTYLGVTADQPRFRPTIFRAKDANAALQAAMDEPGAGERSRISVLLAAEEFPLTRTVTHVLWAMYGSIGPKTEQKPHRHQSIALDFIVDCQPGCYTLVGTELNTDGTIANPVRVDWEPGCAFITPPGYWHAHYNESERFARLIPIQDAGLQTYLRTLDIRFT